MRPSVLLSKTYLNKKQRAINLRKRGYSYSEIAHAAKISKSTAYYWTRRVKLSEFAQTRINKKLKEAFGRGLAAYNKIYSKIRSQEAAKIRDKYRDKAYGEIKNLSRKDLKLIGVALYWAEGNKKSRNTFRFSNSDPYMIKVAMKFIRKVAEIPDEKITAKMHIYPQIDRQVALSYWSEITNLPKNRFAKPFFQISKASKRKRHPNTLPYGTLHLDVYSTELAWKMRGWIKGIAENLLRV